MPSSTISLGLGLGGGKSATSSGAPAAGGAMANDYSASFVTTDFFTTDSSVVNFYESGGAISAWVKPSSVTASATLPHLFRSIISKANVYISLCISNTGYPVLYFYDGAVRQVTGSTQVSTSTWMHVMATWTTSGCKVFVNGSEEASSSNTPADVASGQTGGVVFIGKTQNPGCDHFTGVMDELALFTSDQASNASAIYNGGKAVDLGSDGLNLSPVNWWRMGDSNPASAGTGLSTVTDLGSGNKSATQATAGDQPVISTDVP